MFKTVDYYTTTNAGIKSTSTGTSSSSSSSTQSSSLDHHYHNHHHPLNHLNNHHHHNSHHHSLTNNNHQTAATTTGLHHFNNNNNNHGSSSLSSSLSALTSSTSTLTGSTISNNNSSTNNNNNTTSNSNNNLAAAAAASNLFIPHFAMLSAAAAAAAAAATSHQYNSTTNHHHHHQLLGGGQQQTTSNNHHYHINNNNNLGGSSVGGRSNSASSSSSSDLASSSATTTTTTTTNGNNYYQTQSNINGGSNCHHSPTIFSGHNKYQSSSSSSSSSHNNNHHNQFTQSQSQHNITSSNTANSTSSSSGGGTNQTQSSSSSSTSSNSHSNEEETDKIVGYGAFGVVWSVTDPRSGRRVALKKMPNVFQTAVSARRVFREVKMLCTLKHDNILHAVDVLQPPVFDLFHEVYILTELMQSDLHKIISSPQSLTTDHVKLFLYQILRGVKYLHSSHIIHRDIKPGNLLVNSNCLLKICDFGLARVVEKNLNRDMTQEVVTQYYRAPELLLGTKHYDFSVDMWSIGCIFGELLNRKIMFLAANPLKQVDKIVDVLGTPGLDEIRSACDAAKRYIIQNKQTKPRNQALLNSIVSKDEEAKKLLLQLLCWDPDKRISAEKALQHRYIHEGRLRFHSCMCACCVRTHSGLQFCTTLEPQSPFHYDDTEEKFTNVYYAKEFVHKWLTNMSQKSSVPLCINPNSPSYKTFVQSQVALPHELPPSPHNWTAESSVIN